MGYKFIVKKEYEGKTLFVFLRSGAGISSSLIRSVKYDENGIRRNGARAKTNEIVKEGDEVEISPKAEDNDLSPCGAVVPVVFENDDVIVFDKPAGMATHPTRNYKDGTLANVYARILSERGERGSFHPTNRLDRNTSGLVLAAKNGLVTPALAASAKKKYYAIVEGVFADDAGRIDSPIGLADGSIIKRKVSPDGLPSSTVFRVVKRFKEHTLLEVETLTGRTHQIRVHMSSIGYPLAGDELYGGDEKYIKRQALHCAEISFICPFKEEHISLVSRLPDDMLKLIEGEKL